MSVSEEDFQGVMEGLAQAAAFIRGDAGAQTLRVHVPERVDVKAIRRRLGMTQAAFAARFGFSKAAVTDWEQGRRQPEASARVLMKVIEREPEAVDRALSAAQ